MMLSELIELQNNILKYRLKRCVSPTEDGRVSFAVGCISEENEHLTISSDSEKSRITVDGIKKDTIMAMELHYPLEQYCMVYTENYRYTIYKRDTYVLEIHNCTMGNYFDSFYFNVNVSKQPHIIHHLESLDEDFIFGLKTIYDASSIELLIELFKQSPCSTRLYLPSVDLNDVRVLNDFLVGELS